MVLQPLTARMPVWLVGRSAVTPGVVVLVCTRSCHTGHVGLHEWRTWSQAIHSTSTTAAPQPSATAPAHRTPSANLSGASSPCSRVHDEACDPALIATTLGTRVHESLSCVMTRAGVASWVMKSCHNGCAPGRRCPPVRPRGTIRTGTAGAWRA
jgi:hypothetical protein